MRLAGQAFFSGLKVNNQGLIILDSSQNHYFYNEAKFLRELNGGQKSIIKQGKNLTLETVNTLSVGQDAILNKNDSPDMALTKLKEHNEYLSSHRAMIKNNNSINGKYVTKNEYQNFLNTVSDAEIVNNTQQTLRTKLNIASKKLKDYEELLEKRKDPATIDISKNIQEFLNDIKSSRKTESASPLESPDFGTKHIRDTWAIVYFIAQHTLDLIKHAKLQVRRNEDGTVTLIPEGVDFQA